MQKKRQLKIQRVSIQNTSRCNLHCKLCPHSYVIADNGKDMEISIWYKIIKNLADNEINPDIILDIMGEPLLDKTLKEKINILKDHISSRLIIVTNGTMLTSELIDFFANNNTIISISILGGSKNKYKDITGLDRSKTISKIISCMSAGVNVSSNIVMMEEDKKLRKIFNNLSIPYIMDSPYLVVREKESFTTPSSICANVNSTAYVSVNGDIFLCCSDWHLKTIVGHINDGLVETWNGDHMNNIRNNMNKGIFPSFCTDDNTFCITDRFNGAC